MPSTIQPNDIPFIDPRVEHVGVSRLRTLNATNLGKINKTLVIQDNDNPLAVLLSYEQYLLIQNKLQSVLKLLEVASNPSTREGISSGMKDIVEGKTIPASEVLSDV